MSYSLLIGVIPELVTLQPLESTNYKYRCSL